MNPENFIPRNDNVVVRRESCEVELVADPAFGGVRSIAFEPLAGSALVLPSTQKDITRAVVLAAGPKCSLKPGEVVGVPHNDAPALKDYDDHGRIWEVWKENQLHYAATVI